MQYNARGLPLNIWAVKNLNLQSNVLINIVYYIFYISVLDIEFSPPRQSPPLF